MTEIRRVLPHDRRMAMSRLLLAGVDPTDAQLTQVERYASRLGIDYDHLWAAYDADGVIGPAALVVPRPGRSGVVFATQPRVQADVATGSRVVQVATQAVSPRQMRLLQVLCNPGELLEQQMYEQGGFELLAVLEYMQRSVPRRAATPAILPGLTALTYSAANRPLFIEGLEGSYEQTLDCPALRGIRAIDDVIEGHMATGRFDASLWTLLMAGHRVAGVGLVNAVEEQDAGELVYLGLCPWARGRGYGRWLVEHALAQCAQQGLRVFMLAVDQANTPAVRLYRRLGLYRVARKQAMIKVVNDQGDES